MIVAPYPPPLRVFGPVCQVTKDEFVGYYTNVGAAIDEDTYFEALVGGVWGLDPPRQVKKNISSFKFALYPLSHHLTLCFSPHSLLLGFVCQPASARVLNKEDLREAKTQVPSPSFVSSLTFQPPPFVRLPAFLPHHPSCPLQ